MPSHFNSICHVFSGDVSSSSLLPRGPPRFFVVIADEVEDEPDEEEEERDEKSQTLATPSKLLVMQPNASTSTPNVSISP